MADGARTVAFATLGCKLNQFETDSIATRMRRTGYRIVGFDGPADVYVVNTCTVTNRADRKSRNLFNRAIRRKHPDPGPLLVLTGCFVDHHRDELEADAQTWILPNDNKQSIPDLVDAHFRGEIIHPSGSVFDFPVPDRVFHTRSTVKIQDGCDNHCSFCIIPSVRGRAQSRPWKDVTAAVSEALRGGAREIVLTGVNMSRYRDGEIGFAALVERCLERGDATATDYRLRISSLEPDGLTDRFVRLFNHRSMAPHLHLCLQSGSQRMLFAMRRQYNCDEYRRIVADLRAINPLFNITTDMLVGFPSESDEDFARSLAAVEEFNFGHVHTFPYSARTGTRAARLPDDVRSHERSRRAVVMRSAASASQHRYRERLVGTTQRLLVERVEERGAAFVLHGLGEYYVPIHVELDRRPEIPAATYENRFLDARIVTLDPGVDAGLSGVPA